MPLINGQKMACEPCIRGHRSTKCTHANERLMVPVRKPGRPLSSCPHPSSRPCSCATVTAAIPRKQKCGCEPSTPTAPEVKPERDDSSNEATPLSPTKASNYRIRKPTAKNGSARKQSIDAVVLQRMDASQLNVLPAYDAAHQKPSSTAAENSPPIQGMPLFNSYNLTPTTANFNAAPMLFPMFPQQMNGTMNVSESPDLVASKVLPTIPNGISNGIAVTNGSATSGSCCSGKNGASSEPLAPPASIITAPSSCCGGAVEKKPKPKSCCSSNGTSEASNPVSEPLHLPDMTAQTNGIMMSPFPSPVIIPNGMYHYFPPPTVFTYPPQYGSYLQPLQPEQWRQFMSSMTYNQAPNPGAVDLRATVPLPIYGTPETSAGSTHQCSCGDGCQCVGCASHPYNEATQNYVRSAWNSMAEDAQGAGEHGHSHKAYINGNGNASHDATTNGHSNGIDPAFQHHGDGAISPPAPQTPSDVASNDEQTLSASDFFFVTYPFGGSCAGETASCPCGDDCQCIGCAIHNNPGPALSDE